MRDAAEGWALPERTTKAWARNDLKDLENYPEWCGCLNTVGERDTYGRLVDGRNRVWPMRSSGCMPAVSVFAAVGALHMVGSQGLPVLCRPKVSKPSGCSSAAYSVVGRKIEIGQ